MRAAVLARLRSSLHPRPADHVAFVAGPLLAAENARRRWVFEVAFRARHPSGAGVPRHLERIGCAFAARAVRPGAWQLPVLVSMLRTCFHAAPMLTPLRSRFAIRTPERKSSAPVSQNKVPTASQTSLRSVEVSNSSGEITRNRLSLSTKRQNPLAGRYQTGNR